MHNNFPNTFKEYMEFVEEFDLTNHWNKSVVDSLKIQHVAAIMFYDRDLEPLFEAQRQYKMNSFEDSFFTSMIKRATIRVRQHYTTGEEFKTYSFEFTEKQYDAFFELLKKHGGKNE